MGKLPVLTPGKIIKILKKNGFELDHFSGSHAIFYNAKDSRRVVVPRHPKDLPKGTLMSIIKQAGLDKSDLS